MKNKIKISLLLAMAISMIMAISAFAGEWVKDGENWKYKDDNGAFVVSDWKFLKYTKTDGTTNYGNFYFDEFGNMCTGIKKLGNDYYSFNADGSANSNSTVDVFGKIYKTKKHGVMIDTFTAIDVDAYNAKFKQDNAPKSAEQIAKEQAEAAEKAEKESAMQALAADSEKRGPKSVAGRAGLAAGSDKFNGPGALEMPTINYGGLK